MLLNFRSLVLEAGWHGWLLSLERFLWKHNLLGLMILRTVAGFGRTHGHEVVAREWLPRQLPLLWFFVCALEINKAC